MNIVSKKTVNDKEIGKIIIADEVIATIAGTATLEVKGVYCTPSNNKGAIINWINKKSLSKDVVVTVKDNEIYVEVSIVINVGFNLTEVSVEVQEKIQNALEVMTGMVVKEVNVTILGIVENTEEN